MNVWIMNIKDNREDKPDDLAKSKFDFCKEKGIVGIGWAKLDIENTENTEDTAFLQANQAIDSFEIGDLIWVKNPLAEAETEKNYLCKVLEKAKKTDDETMNKYDIGKYCTCEYYPVQSLPEELSEERLIAVHTIEKANDTVTDKTLQFFKTIKEKKRSKKGKVGIIAIVCAVALILGMIFVPGVIKFINKKTHPILPDGIEFGMTYDEIKNISENKSWGFAFDSLSYDAISRDYSNTVHQEEGGFPLSFSGRTLAFLSFNSDKQLYKISFNDNLHDDSDSKNYFNEYCNYYNKAFGNIEIQDSDYGEQYGVCSDGDIRCLIDEEYCLITIESAKYAPVIPEISKDEIGSAFMRLKYNIRGFSINLYELLVSCVSNIDMTYYPLGNAYGIVGSDVISSIEKGANSKYAATSYVIVVHGDICQNPDLPYLKTEDVDVIKVLLMFDDNGNLQDWSILDECSELNTCAVLTMFG